MTAILGRTGNLVGFTTGRGTTPWNTEMEAALRKMDAMLASTVVAITNTLPGSANEGDLYLVGTSPTGVAAGWANRIARWRSSPAGWEAYPPMEGWIITIVGESTNKVRRYNGTAWVALAADAGAEPYAGVPAQTSFWRSTAAGVRAWVQLVAADITDLATTLAGYLTKTNPTFTGTLTGPRATLTEFGKFQGLPGIPEYGALYGSGVNPTTTNYALRVADDGSDTLVNGAVHVAIAIGGLSKVGVYADQLSLASGVALKMSATTVIDSSRNANVNSLTATTLSGSGNRPVVAKPAGNLEAQDPATFLGTIGAAPSSHTHAAGDVTSGTFNEARIPALPTSRITGLDTALAGKSDVGHVHSYLPVNNPAFTGTLTGPNATLTEFGIMRDRVGNPTFGALYAAGVTPDTINYTLAMTDAGTETYLAASGKVVLVVGGTSKLTVTASEVNLASGVALKMSATTVIDSSRNITGTTVKGLNAAGVGIRPAVALADGTFDDQDAATFRGTIGALAASLKGTANGVAELGADGKVPSTQLPASSSPIVSVAKTMEFALANETTPSPVQILTVPVPVGFFTTNGMIELDIDLDLLYFAAGNRIILSFEVGVSEMWYEWNDDIPADAPRVFHGYIGKYKEESGETFVRMAGTLNGVRISGEYHDVTSTVAVQTSFNVSAHVVIEGAGAHVNCAVGKVFA